MKPTQRSVYIAVFFLCLGATQPLQAGGHAGNGQENHPTGIVLAQMPDKDALLEALSHLEPDFPVLVWEMQKGVNEALNIRQPYTNPEFIAFSTYDPFWPPLKSLFMIDYYDNYFNQELKARISTLIHELFHYVFRRENEFTHENPERQKQEMERDISFMTSLTLAIIDGKDQDHSLKNHLGQYLTKYAFGSASYRYGEMHIRDRYDFYDPFYILFLPKLSDFLPTRSMVIGGMENKYVDLNPIFYRTNFEPFYRRALDGPLSHDDFMIDWNAPSSHKFLQSLNLRGPETLKNALTIQWEKRDNDEKDSDLSQAWIYDHLMIDEKVIARGLIRRVFSFCFNDIEASPVIRISEKQAALLFEDWKLYKEISRSKTRYDHLLRFSVSIENLIPEKIQKHFEETQFMLNPSNENIPQALKEVIQCDGKLEIYRNNQSEFFPASINARCTPQSKKSAWEFWKEEKLATQFYEITSIFLYVRGQNERNIKAPRLVFEVKLSDE